MMWYAWARPALFTSRPGRNYIGLESKTNRENLWPAVPDTYYPGSVGYIVGQLYDGNLVRCMDPLQSPIGGALPTIWINTAFGIRKRPGRAA